VSSADAIVVGAGHNGLVAAALLARQGLRVRVLEARDVVGGLCAGGEFHPGYRHAGVHHDSGGLRPWVVDALQLEHHGLELRTAPPVLVPSPSGSSPAAGIVLHDDVERTATDAGMSSNDAAGWRRIDAFVGGVAPLIRRILDEPAPRMAADGTPLWPVVQQAVALRRLGAERMLELMRVAVLSTEDWFSESLDTPRLRAALALPALLGAYMGPMSPQSTGLWLAREALQGVEVVGGPARLVEVLAAAAQHHGASIETRHAVDRVIVERGAVRGVVSRGGEEIAAPIVVSALDPRRTLLDLVPPLELPPLLEDEVRAHRMRPTSAKLHLALSGPPSFSCRAGSWERVRVVRDVRELERAFDAVKHRQLPDRPALDVRFPTMSRSDLAPEGHHVASIHVFGVPYRPAGGWSAAATEQLLDSVLSELQAVAPGIADTVVAAELLTPSDLEARYGVTNGHLMHGEHALDQLWSARPGPRLSGHATPIRGLFLASGGTHPGGGVSGAPGALAARAALAAP
jgi:phytoene dehydrogenase-like protein